MNRIPVYFNPNQQAASNDSYSPSAQKPGKALLDWQTHGLPIEIMDFTPVSIDLLKRVHLPDYVDGVFALECDNGFENRNPDVARSLPWTTGSLVAAAFGALANGKVACSPTSGFHHAYYGKGGDYCTFNGLLATVLAVRDHGFMESVGILDLDAHWADGTEDVIKNVAELHEGVEHYNFGGDIKDFTPPGIEEWMDSLPSIVQDMVRKTGLIIYQAGADPHENDPLGGFMSSEQMLLRDRIVFETCMRERVPLVWNLAGGYQEPFDQVLELHRATMQACAEVFITT